MWLSYLKTLNKAMPEAHEGDGVYIDRPHQKRGGVQKGNIQTIKPVVVMGVVVKNNIINEKMCFFLHQELL